MSKKMCLDVAPISGNHKGGRCKGVRCDFDLGPEYGQVSNGHNSSPLALEIEAYPLKAKHITVCILSKHLLIPRGLHVAQNTGWFMMVYILQYVNIVYSIYDSPMTAFSQPALSPMPGEAAAL